MTEAEWLACDDPGPMVHFVGDTASIRKLRLFACACLRRIWHLLPGEPIREAVQVFEGLADGQATEAEIIRACAAADRVSDLADTSLENCVGHALNFFVDSINEEYGKAEILNNITGVAFNAADAHAWGEVWSEVQREPLFAAPKARAAAERVTQAGMVREIVGNPHCSIQFPPAFRTVNATALAEAIYADRAFDRLPILADALEEADCTNTDILDHCRGPGPHVRGCWVVDLVLGKS